MAIIVTSIVFALLFLWMFLSERKCARRSREFFARADEHVQTLTEITQKRYRDRFGKDPTGGFPTMRAEEPERHWIFKHIRRK